MYNKGFTLRELLAVIIVVAALTLFATPLVSSILTKSYASSIKNEVLALVHDTEKAYTTKSTRNIINTEVKDGVEAKTIRLNEKTYAYLCMTIKDLVNENYTKNNIGGKYNGYVQLWVSEDNETFTFVNVSSMNYYMQGTSPVISLESFVPTLSPAQGIEEPKENTTCPSDYSYPTNSVHNIQSNKVEEEIKKID